MTSKLCALASMALALLCASIAMAQPAAPTASPRTPAYAPPPAAPAHGPIPSRSETAMEAFGKLNRANAGYLTWDDVRQLDGFETAFEQADQNRDGRLNPAEFNSAWSMYTGSNP